MSISTEKIVDYSPVGNSDVRLTAEISNGFLSVNLYDADDYDVIILIDDNVVALRDALNEIIEKSKGKW